MTVKKRVERPHTNGFPVTWDTDKRQREAIRSGAPQFGLQTSVKGKVGAGQAVTLTIPGLPAGTTAVTLNLTATNPTATSYLTVYPAGTIQPGTANLSFTKGQTISNMVIVAVGTDAKVTVYNKRRDRGRHRADLTGYFTG